MGPFSRAARPAHAPVIRTLHWLTLGVLLLTVSVILAREGLEGKGLRQWVLSLHRDLGLFIWVLACVRLWVRSQVPMSDSLVGAPRWQRVTAHAVHGLLYLLLLGTPLLGLALTNARGQPVMLPWVGSLPAWPARDPDLADTLEGVHATAAWMLTAVVGAHAAVALWHHRFLRDDVLAAMLPRLRRSPRR